MSEQAARSWLSSHRDIVPALEIHHRQATKILEDHSRTVADLAAVVALDPGLSLTLFNQVNSKLHQGGRPPVGSVQVALGLLGDSAIADLVLEHRVLDERRYPFEQRQSYHQLMSRTHHLLAQLEFLCSFQGIGSLNDVRSAGLLYNIGEFCACLLDYDRYLRYQEKFRALGSDANSARPIFGFDFNELGHVCAEHWYLPELLSEALDKSRPPGRKAQLIRLAADVSHQAEIGWYHTSMKATEEVCAAFLNQSLTGFHKRLQKVAIDAARSSPYPDALPAAARLIMLPDAETPALSAAQANEAEKPPGKALGFDTRMRALLQTERPNQAQILDLLLRHLNEDLHLTRVALLLISPDRRKLGTRAGKGIDEHSPIRTLVLDLTQGGLIRSIMQKTQALWVEPELYQKYAPALSGKFKQAFLHESFFLMSMHVSNRPFALLYADRLNAVNRLDKAAYIRFKSAVLLTIRALAFLGRKKQQSTA